MTERPCLSLTCVHLVTSQQLLCFAGGILSLEGGEVRTRIAIFGR